MSTITKEQIETTLSEKLSAPYTLILWNDNYNTFEWVIECLIKFCKHHFEQACQCAQLVHYKGKCDVKRGDKETISEMYDKLKLSGLTVTMQSN